LERETATMRELATAIWKHERNAMRANDLEMALRD
jgi:hypothetical protein